MECVVCYENECRCVPKSIIGEHYGFSEALIEQMQDSNEDCHEHIGEENEN